MKLPVAPPVFAAQIDKLIGQPARFARVLRAGLGAAPGGKYRHWDTFRHSPPLDDLTPEEQWVAVKVARQAIYRVLPLTDSRGASFRYALPDIALEMLHQIDRDASGSIRAADQVTNPSTRDSYLFKSIVEEAITSSQLEGASTTRKVAKAMIQEGRTPETRSERMILNNYEAMRSVLRMVDQPLTPSMVIELQRVLTEGTLDDPEAVGRLRRADEEIVIEDAETGTRLHTPPPADQLERRLKTMCDFANGTSDTAYMPPAARAVLLHFWLAYDHPFVDGNGRTARALFYWSMARAGYWLCEYVSVSRILKKARGQYARAYLYTESDDNDATYFMLYQLRVLLRAINDLHVYLAKKASEMAAAEEQLRRMARLRGEWNARQLALLNHALKHSEARYTVESHQRSHNVTYQTARTDLLKLVDQGLLILTKVGRAFVFEPSRRIGRLGSTPTLSRRAPVRTRQEGRS